MRRQEIFKNLDKYLKVIRDEVLSIDPGAEVYLFGSVAENRYTYSSDIDILIITDLVPGIVISRLWRAGIEEPFEIHVYKKKYLPIFRRKGKLIKIN